MGIEEGVFNNCENVTINGNLPSNITRIGENAFCGCTKLFIDGDLPSGITSIGGYLSEKLTYIGNNAFSFFEDSNKTNTRIPGVKIQWFKSRILPLCLTYIGDNANISDTTVTFLISSNIAHIGYHAFINCRLNINVPMKYVHIDAFVNCNIYRIWDNKNAIYDINGITQHFQIDCYIRDGIIDNNSIIPSIFNQIIDNLLLKKMKCYFSLNYIISNFNIFKIYKIYGIQIIQDRNLQYFAKISHRNRRWRFSFL